MALEVVVKLPFLIQHGRHLAFQAAFQFDPKIQLLLPVNPVHTLERIQPISTEDVLRRVPGVHIKGEEESAVIANIVIRGLNAADYKTLILKDGVPVAPGLFVGNQRY